MPPQQRLNEVIHKSGTSTAFRLLNSIRSRILASPACKSPFVAHQLGRREATTDSRVEDNFLILVHQVAVWRTCCFFQPWPASARRARRGRRRAGIHKTYPSQWKQRRTTHVLIAYQTIPPDSGSARKTSVAECRKPPSILNTERLVISSLPWHRTSF